MKTRVKISHFRHALKALFGFPIVKSLAPYVLTCVSVLSHNFGLAFFYDQVWVNNKNNIVEHGSSCLPVINRTSEFLLACPSVSRVFGSSKSILQPDNQGFLTVCDFNHRVPLEAVPVFALFNSANIETTFSVYDSRKVSQLFDCVFGLELNYFSHKYPFVGNIAVINEKVHAERLSERGPKGYAIV